jgi:hypothetical protein
MALQSNRSARASGVSTGLALVVGAATLAVQFMSAGWGEEVRRAVPPALKNPLFYRDAFHVFYMPIIFVGWGLVVSRVSESRLSRGTGAFLVLAWAAFVIGCLHATGARWPWSGS